MACILHIIIYKLRCGFFPYMLWNPTRTSFCQQRQTFASILVSPFFTIHRIRQPGIMPSSVLFLAHSHNPYGDTSPFQISKLINSFQPLALLVYLRFAPYPCPCPATGLTCSLLMRAFQPSTGTSAFHNPCLDVYMLFLSVNKSLTFILPCKVSA